LLKLPKDLASDPRHDEVAELLARDTSLLWESGRSAVASVALTKRLTAVMRGAMQNGFAAQGMELITEKLAAEQKGLDAAASKAPESPQQPRVSRLLFLANDGSTRFYRDADGLLHRYSQRLLACRLDVAGEALGEALFGSPQLVRSVLVHDKKVVTRALLALLPD